MADSKEPAQIQNNEVKWISSLLLSIDKAFEELSKILLLIMIVIVCFQVFARKLFSYTPTWSLDATIFLLIWFSFLGIAMGFRERIHLAFNSIHFSEKADFYIERVISIIEVVFALILIVYGTKLMLNDFGQVIPTMGNLPIAYRTLAVPVSGVLILFYGILQFFGIDLKRHKGLGGGH
ncbi:TRAP transporter small permease [Pelosinus propionicus]|uniref:TRAP-type C4-dicarboxylate transport system, small permease component n=1 Tax=Pelosinus propionicus DSM 13327 TaxID=1123291 RepID=A0A1I4IGG3_9FIRM|nr:TRAP transporter small permease [Pelosinus propionicus]SFL53385.1 TRAP-type C4-dicarboxylate transport system, small permease component [Pelosinus propionicus DSM 13327]